MGSDQSRTANTAGTESGPPDYYELLQISEDATADEIKVGKLCIVEVDLSLTKSQRSYRKLAVCPVVTGCERVA